MDISNFLKEISSMEKIAQVIKHLPQRRAIFWTEILEELRKKEKPFTGEDLKDSDFPNSLFGVVNKYCDLPTGKEERKLLLSKLYLELSQVTQETSFFWNESVQNLIKFFIDNIEDLEGRNDLIAGVAINKDDIKNSNAGNSFERSPWVRPNVNVDMDTYDQVRGHDEVNDILESLHKLKFTHSQNQEEMGEDLNKWIRLLLPNYGRRTLIEDLDRNFWVIAQCLAAISSFLFDDDSPLTQVLKDIFNEIVQLWENILYLWLFLAIVTQKEKEMQTIVFYVSEDVLYPNKKYDNFEKDNNMSLTYDDDFNLLSAAPTINTDKNIRQAVETYAQKYPDNDLCLLPVIRIHNYKSNYHSTEYYPCIYFYDSTRCIWYKHELKIKGMDVIISLEDSLEQNVIRPEDYKIYACREEKYGYSYLCPFSETEGRGVADTPGQIFYGNIRIVPDIVINRDNDTVLTSFSLKGYDAAHYLFNSEEPYSPLFTMDMTQEIKAFEESVITLELQNNQQSQTSDYQRKEFESLYDTKAFYQGETISWWKKTSAVILEDATFEMVKIGDFYPINIDTSRLTRITRTSGSGYSTDVFGLGSYYYPSAAFNSVPAQKYITFYRYTGNSVKKVPTSKLTPENVRDFGIDQIKALYMGNDGFKKTTLITTKMGVGFWLGDSGSQWSYGIVTDLFAIIKGEQEVHHLGYVNKLDGYWNMSVNPPADEYPVFTTRAVRFRNLTLRADKVWCKKIGQNIEWFMEGGQWIWQDHNTNDNIVAKCPMELSDPISTDKYNTYYSILENTSDPNSRQPEQKAGPDGLDIAVSLDGMDCSSMASQTEQWVLENSFNNRGSIGSNPSGRYNPAILIFS